MSPMKTCHSEVHYGKFVEYWKPATIEVLMGGIPQMGSLECLTASFTSEETERPSGSGEKSTSGLDQVSMLVLSGVSGPTGIACDFRYDHGNWREPSAITLSVVPQKPLRSSDPDWSSGYLLYWSACLEAGVAPPSLEGWRRLREILSDASTSQSESSR